MISARETSMTFRTASHLLLGTLIILCGVSPARPPKPVGVAQSESNSTLLASTPPMGWNSWDACGYTVREDEVKANADYMAKNLAGYGWQYIVVDIEWYTPRTKSNG
jgi:hypothetical protein